MCCDLHFRIIVCLLSTWTLILYITYHPFLQSVYFQVETLFIKAAGIFNLGYFSISIFDTYTNTSFSSSFANDVYFHTTLLVWSSCNKALRNRPTATIALAKMILTKYGNFNYLNEMQHCACLTHSRNQPYPNPKARSGCNYLGQTDNYELIC